MGLTLLDTLTSIDQNIQQLNSENTSTVSVTTTVPASTTSVPVLPANTARKGLMLYNDTMKACFIKLGASASLADYSFKMPAGSLYESESISYVGEISAIFEVATGSLRVTQLT